MSAEPRRRGPRAGGEDTRADILEAALAEFSDRGFEKPSIRGIARAAGVDPSLVRHYFSSKEELFIKAMGPLDQIGPRADAIVGGPRDEVGKRAIENFLAIWDSPVYGPRVLALLRSAAAHPAVAQLMRTLLMTTLFTRLAAHAPPERREECAAATASHMIGLAFARYVVKLEPLASATREELIEQQAPLIQAMITGDGVKRSG